MWEFEEIDGDLGDILLKNFTNCFRPGYVKSRGYILPEYYKKFGQKVKELEVRDDDLWVVSFPKTGKFFSQPRYILLQPVCSGIPHIFHIQTRFYLIQVFSCRII